MCISFDPYKNLGKQQMQFISYELGTRTSRINKGSQSHGFIKSCHAHHFSLALSTKNQSHFGDRSLWNFNSTKIFLSCCHHPKANTRFTCNLAATPTEKTSLRTARN